MKLHSIQDRRDRRPEKAASDAEDLYPLIEEQNVSGVLADEVAAAPDLVPVN
jgi:hypothetical protein